MFSATLAGHASMNLSYWFHDCFCNFVSWFSSTETLILRCYYYKSNIVECHDVNLNVPSLQLSNTSEGIGCNVMCGCWVGRLVVLPLDERRLGQKMTSALRLSFLVIGKFGIILPSCIWHNQAYLVFQRCLLIHQFFITRILYKWIFRFITIYCLVSNVDCFSKIAHLGKSNTILRSVFLMYYKVTNIHHYVHLLHNIQRHDFYTTILYHIPLGLHYG